ncbi:hypothetical protein AaE_011732 [Aphanomyces astaci]|uniref:Uncharacterized protein n=1 Tax=Aphanomyces astaci TaxID=112090 RepID=A0A6A4ZTV0_APHAT|nr:hypothetical protein AaE_011732 [Aphanomyces astaci]
MLSRVIRRFAPRVARPAIAANVDLDTETHGLRFLHLPLLPSKFPQPAPQVCKRPSLLDPFLKLHLIRSQLRYGLSVVGVPPTKEPVDVPPHITFDLNSLLETSPHLPPNEIQQDYSFDRRSSIDEIPMERYVALGQHLYQSMMWTTHPCAWHAVGQRCA